MIAKIFLMLFGIAFLGGGIYGLIYAHGAQGATAADPVCTQTLTMGTPPAAGPTCTIFPATIVRAYTSYGRRSATDEIVVTTQDGTRLTVPLADRRTEVFAEASRGAAATIETIEGKAAFIATSFGSEASASDPRRFGTIAWVFIALGALLVIVSIFGRARPRRNASAYQG